MGSFPTKRTKKNNVPLFSSWSRPLADVGASMDPASDTFSAFRNSWSQEAINFFREEAMRSAIGPEEKEDNEELRRSGAHHSGLKSDPMSSDEVAGALHVDEELENYIISQMNTLSIGKRGSISKEAERSKLKRTNSSEPPITCWTGRFAVQTVEPVIEPRRRIHDTPATSENMSKLSENVGNLENIIDFMGEYL